jgi:hypothetical protein
MVETANAKRKARKKVPSLCFRQYLFSGNRLALTLSLSPRRGNPQFPRWKESLSGEYAAAFVNFSLSPGERVGVRASVLRN